MRNYGSFGKHRGCPIALVLAAFLWLLIAAPFAQAATGNKSGVTHIELGEPAGFSSLTGEQSAVVDVFFGNKRIGDAKVTFRPGRLTISDPEKLVTLLPDLIDRTAVLTALSAPDLPSRPELICTPSANPEQCGRLLPQVAGIIFDQDRFRLDIFVNPQLMAIRQSTSRQYVQRPEAGLSIVNAISAVMSGSSRGQRFYNLQNNLIVGDADRRLRAEFAYASGFGLQADRLVMELDRPERRYMAGAFWAPGTDLIGRRKIVGLGIETQIDTRLDKDEVWGNPLVVFLNQRSRVDIVRDGRVLTSRIYDAGNQTLDTRGMPNGTYEVTLRISEAGGGQREDKRLFIKNQKIAAIGQKVFFAYAGVLADDRRRGFVAPTSTPFFQAGIARRLNMHLALDATVLATDKTVSGELGAFYLTPFAQIRLAAVATSQGQYGGLLNISSQGSSRLGFNFDLRRIKAADVPTLPGNSSTKFGPPDSIGADFSTSDANARLPLARRSFSQVSGSLSYSLGNARLAFDATYRKEQGQPVNYSYGPSFNWEFLRRGPLRMSANGNLAITNRGRSGFVGINLQLLGAKTSFDASAGLRSADIVGEPSRNRPVGSVHGSWQGEKLLGADATIGAGLQHDLESDVLNGSAELRGDKFSLNADVIHTMGQAGNPTQYSVGFQTSIGLRGGSVAFKGRELNDSMVIVKVDGAGPKDRFEVLVNDGKAGELRGRGSSAVAVAGYRQYEVRIRQTDGDLLHYDGSVRRVGLYPGNVARLSWKARKVVAMFGRLLTTSGEPVRLASVTNPAGIGETDDNGYFQIEAESGSALEVALPGGASCHVDLPQLQPKDGYAPLGNLICRPLPTPFRLSSAEK